MFFVVKRMFTSFLLWFGSKNGNVEFNEGQTTASENRSGTNSPETQSNQETLTNSAQS